jgi:hypothetical protein
VKKPRVNSKTSISDNERYHTDAVNEADENGSEWEGFSAVDGNGEGAGPGSNDSDEVRDQPNNSARPR